MNATEVKAGKNTLYYQSNGAKIAADMYLPTDFDASKNYPTIFFTRPATQVKEQAAAVYGKKFADKGYVFFAFEPLNYGESDGDIRNYESTEHILLNISDGISFLRSFDFVDRSRLMGVGLCMGSMYMSYTALMDKRLKALVTVSGYLNNASFLFGMMPKEQVLAMLEMQSEEKQKYYETGKLQRADLLGGMFDKGLPEGLPKFYNDAYDYYFTERAGAQIHPNYTNMVPSFQPTADIRLNAVGFADYLYTPYLGIRGDLAMTGPMTDEFFQKASEPKEMYVIKNAGHFDLYDIDNYVNIVIERAITFFNKHV
jgi:hypothetical protein